MSVHFACFSSSQQGEQNGLGIPTSATHSDMSHGPGTVEHWQQWWSQTIRPQPGMPGGYKGGPTDDGPLPPLNNISSGTRGMGATQQYAVPSYEPMRSTYAGSRQAEAAMMRAAGTGNRLLTSSYPDSLRCVNGFLTVCILLRCTMLSWSHVPFSHMQVRAREFQLQFQDDTAKSPQSRWLCWARAGNRHAEAHERVALRHGCKGGRQSRHKGAAVEP